MYNASMDLKHLLTLLCVVFCMTAGLPLAQDIPPAKTQEQTKPGDWRPMFDGKTTLLIQPGHEFRAIDGLITNFHLPRSSLLALVAAFAGLDNVMSAYHEAIKEGYRFYSYGDAMLIL